MKRAIALLLALTVLGTAGIVYTHMTVSASAEAVEMRETVLSGDRALAEGVEVHFPTECKTWLHWDTTLRVGAENETQTDFRVSSEKQWTWKWMSNLPLSLAVSDNIGGEILPKPEHELYALVSDVASRVPSGTSGGESVRLRDYYEYMPLHVALAQEMNVNLVRGVDIRESDVQWNYAFSEQFDSALEQRIRELYAIPVPEDYYLNVSVEKSTAGDVVQWSVLPQREEQVLYLSYEACSTEQGIWVAANLRGGDGQFSCAGADKLWYIPAGLAGEMTCVMELDPGEEVQRITTDALGRAVLITVRDGGNYIKFADSGGVGPVQTLSLPELRENDAIHRLYTGENFALLKSWMGHFELFGLTQSGEYVPRLSGEMGEPGRNTVYNDSSVVLRWNGQRLVMAAAAFGTDNSQMDQCTGFLLWVFDVDGGSFCARYDSSLAIPKSQGYSLEFQREGELSLH